MEEKEKKLEHKLFIFFCRKCRRLNSVLVLLRVFPQEIGQICSCGQEYSLKVPAKWDKEKNAILEMKKEETEK